MNRDECTQAYPLVIGASLYQRGTVNKIGTNCLKFYLNRPSSVIYFQTTCCANLLDFSLDEDTGLQNFSELDKYSGKLSKVNLQYIEVV